MYEFLSIVLIIFGVLQIILLFKMWGMTNDIREMRGYAKGQSYKCAPLYQHNYWWTDSENVLTGDAFSLYSESVATRGAGSMGSDWRVMAFKNGEMEE